MIAILRPVFVRSVFLLVAAFVIIAGCGAVDSSAQTCLPGSLTTTFAGGNENAGNMFDITAVNTVVVNSFDVAGSFIKTMELFLFTRRSTVIE